MFLQLHDTLLQREEELARLQEENTKLREFLGSSYVRDLEEKAKVSSLLTEFTCSLKRISHIGGVFVSSPPPKQKLSIQSRMKMKMKMKRHLTHDDERTPQTSAHCLMVSKPVSKRVCRNLTAQFCSDSAEVSRSSESNLDLWVLRTLGLKDRDTIDSLDECTSPAGSSLRSLVYDSAVSSFSCPSTDQSFSQSSATSTPSSHCQSSTLQTDYHYSPASCHDLGSALTYSSGQNFSFTAMTPTDLYEAPEAVIRSFNPLPAPQPPANTPAVCPITAFSEGNIQEDQPSHCSVDWSPLEYNQTAFSPPAGRRLTFSPVSSSSPIPKKQWRPAQVCCPLSPSVGLQPTATPQSPRSQTDLAFRMSLSPSNSVKTHSFPQGQAFVSKDKEGRWNFTWLPKQNL